MNLDEVYGVFNKYLHIEDTDRIDAVLATMLTREIKGTKIWLIIVGGSGDWKSELINALDDGGMNTYPLYKITSRALVSGFNGVQDMALRIKNKVILIRDFAQLLKLTPQEKGAVWGSMRDLYDGFAGIDSGSGKTAKYSDLNVTMIGASTPAIDEQILIFQDLGNRELIYRSKEYLDEERILKKLLERGIDLEEMKMKIRKTTQDFLRETKFKDIAVDQKISSEIWELCQTLKYMRACGSVDNYTREVNQKIYPEIPTRVFQQFFILYKALKSLDQNYSDDKAMKVIEHIVESSGFPLRVKIYEYMLGRERERFSTSRLAAEFKVGKSSIVRECSMMWNMEIIERNRNEDEFGRCILDEWWIDTKKDILENTQSNTLYSYTVP